VIRQLFYPILMLITILFLVGCSDGSNDNDDANNDNNSEKELT